MVFNENQFLNQAIKLCKVQHFADDTKLFILVNHLINLISISIMARLNPSKSVK